MTLQRSLNDWEAQNTSPSFSSDRDELPHLLICVVSKMGQINAALDIDARLWKTSQVARVLIINQDILSELSDDVRNVFDQVISTPTRKERLLFPEFCPKQLREIIILQQELYQAEETLVYCGGEGNITHVAEAIDGLSVQGFTADKAILFRDKTQMKAFVKSHGIAVPEFISDIKGMTFKELTEALGTPFVIKPTDEGGAFGFHLISDEKDFFQALDGIDDIQSYQAETFLDGELFHVDSVQCLGENPISLVSEYLFPMARCLDGMPAGSIALDQQSLTARKILSIHHKVLKAFNVPGIFHAEYFVTSKGRVVFLEIAWRPAGLPCNVNFEQYAGTNQSTAYLSLATDMLSHSDISFQKPLLMRIFITRQPGAYQGLSLPLPDEAYTISEEIPKGTFCEKGETYMSYVAIIDVYAKTPAQLRKYFMALRESGQSLAVFV